MAKDAKGHGSNGKGGGMAARAGSAYDGVVKNSHGKSVQVSVPKNEKRALVRVPGKDDPAQKQRALAISQQRSNPRGGMTSRKAKK